MKETERAKRNKIKKIERGYAAETAVTEILNSLPDDYAVFHNLPSPFGNIDHVVLHRTNTVYLIETKSHGGKLSADIDKSQILINGKPTEKDFLKQTLDNTFWLKEYLSQTTGLDLFIVPIIVFPNIYNPIRLLLKNVLLVDPKNMMQELYRAQYRKKGSQ